MQYATDMMMSSSALNLKEASSWWSHVNESPVWQDRIFHSLSLWNSFHRFCDSTCENPIQSSRVNFEELRLDSLGAKAEYICVPLLDSLGAKAELFLMLQRFPVESKGRRKKLQEVKRQ
ncbi:hypothetical protein YC2023_085172 [Brassica napus]